VGYRVWRVSLYDKRNGVVCKRSRDEESEMIKMEGWRYLLYLLTSKWVAGDLRKWSPDRSFCF
jgi:hypothetical protein